MKVVKKSANTHSKKEEPLDFGQCFNLKKSNKGALWRPWMHFSSCATQKVNSPKTWTIPNAKGWNLGQKKTHCPRIPENQKRKIQTRRKYFYYSKEARNRWSRHASYSSMINGTFNVFKAKLHKIWNNLKYELTMEREPKQQWANRQRLLSYMVKPLFYSSKIFKIKIEDLVRRSFSKTLINLTLEGNTWRDH